MSDNPKNDLDTFLEVEVKLAVDDSTGIPDLTQLPGVEEILLSLIHI